MKLDKAMIKYQKELAELREEIIALRNEITSLCSAIEGVIPTVVIGEIDVNDETSTPAKSDKRGKKAKVQ